MASAQQFLDFPTGYQRPLARRGDPDSSHQAAKRSADFSGSHEARILACLEHEGEPLTGA